MYLSIIFSFDCAFCDEVWFGLGAVRCGWCFAYCVKPRDIRSCCLARFAHFLAAAPSHFLAAALLVSIGNRIDLSGPVSQRRVPLILSSEFVSATVAEP